MEYTFRTIRAEPHGTGTISWCVGVPRSAMNDEVNLGSNADGSRASSRASGTTEPQKKRKK